MMRMIHHVGGDDWDGMMMMMMMMMMAACFTNSVPQPFHLILDARPEYGHPVGTYAQAAA